MGRSEIFCRFKKNIYKKHFVPVFYYGAAGKVEQQPNWTTGLERNARLV